jgi:hypothetical protein
MQPELCPNCGAEVPSRARSCPECGACEETGWNEDATASRLGLPSESFDYDEFVEQEFGPEKKASRVTPTGISLGWWIVALVLVVLFVLGWVLR